MKKEEKTEKVGLNVNNLTIEEAKELMQKIREIEQRHKKETIFVWVKGLEDKSMKETIEVLKEIFPKVKME